MPRRTVSFLLLLPLLACAPDAAREAEVAQAALESHRATLQALGDAPPPSPAAPAAPPRAAPTRRAASQFLGASPDALLEALGEPTLRREEGSASVWLYAAGGCQLDVVLYPGAGGPRVAHVQARAGGLVQRTEAACLRDLQSRRDEARSRRNTEPGRGPPLELGA
ncbi:hypothetical protein [Sabulicella glaciei]|uniref:Lipoprotein n=1 Tax=Sabulicella glaciei TaxID=2984948 RepID=A0ABT3NXC4_9PROT|nr:hypothetical protein [Roseococcus sp. MDT2-1-1]MCW8086823.1 hypothetical protein [Roseococcus sp. MDT2-1-1]